jgi:YD repeat-containing protein
MGDPAAKTTTFGYDALDRLITVKDAKSLTTTYGYDGLDNLLSLASPDTGTANMTYDDAGNMVTRTDSRGVATSYSYDALDRPMAATTTDGSTTYTYDQGTYGKGHLTGFTDPSGQTSLAYDALGRLSSKTQTIGAKTFTLGYVWSSGQLSSITYPSGHVIAYSYDAAGRPSSLTIDGAGVLSQIKYYPFGPANGWTFATGDV